MNDELNILIQHKGVKVSPREATEPINFENWAFSIAAFIIQNSEFFLVQFSDSIGRPKANNRMTDNIIAGDKTPKMAIITVVAVIAQH